MQLIRDQLMQDSRLTTIGSVFIFLSIVVQTTLGVWLNVSPTVQVETPVSMDQPVDLLNPAIVQRTPVPAAPMASVTVTWPTSTPTTPVTPTPTSIPVSRPAPSYWRRFVELWDSPSVWAEVVVGAFAAVIGGILVNVITYALRLLPSLREGPRIQVGSEKVRVGSENAEQVLSLVKWLEEDNITGWYELREDVLFGDGLRPAVRSVVERELKQAQQKRHRPGIQPEYYEEQLEFLLNPKVNINTANLEMLEVLPGVGHELARRIIEHREQNGPFTTIDDVTEVTGIGPATLDRLRDQIKVNNPER